MAKLPASHQRTTVNWNVPPSTVMDSITSLHASGKLQDAVAGNPELKRVTDALVQQGLMRRDKRGRLVPKFDAQGRPESEKPDADTGRMSGVR